MQLSKSSFLLLVAVQAAAAFLAPSLTFPSSSTTKTSSSFNTLSMAQVENVASQVTNLLEKRLASGKLSRTETSTALKATESLLNQLDELQSPTYTPQQLQQACQDLDIDTVDSILASGMAMTEENCDTAFWAVVNSIDEAEKQDLPLAANVTQMLHRIFDADQQLLLTREKQTTNVTCMQPDDSLDEAGAARKMNYVFDDGDHKNLPLMHGRRCEGGNCCDACSRNIFPTFASKQETDMEMFPDIMSFTFNDLAEVSAKSIVQFVRLVERVRRTIAHEYGLPLKTILPLQAYSRKYVAGTTQQGGGGGEGDFVTLHTDEATHAGYHYSCVLYLSTQGEDFEGGNFVFNDPAPEDEKEVQAMEVKEQEEESDGIEKMLLEALQRGEELPDMEGIIEGSDGPSDSNFEEEVRRAGRTLTPFHPSRGAAVIFSSGWENMHEVEKITSGVRYAVPCFFTTCAVPEAAYQQMNAGLPKSDEDIADDWLHLLLAHRKEEPMESVGRVKELLMKWHYMCTPLSEH